MPQEPAETLPELGERYFTTQHAYDPYNATLLGLTEFDALAGDPSSAASTAAAGAFAAIGGELASLDVDALDEGGRVDHGVLTALVRGAGDDARHSLWAANASAKGYVSRQGLVFQAIPAMTIADADGAERYEQRLAGVGGFLTALGERYTEEAARGRVPTARGVAHAVDQLEGYLELSLDDDPLLAPARGAEPAVRERAREVLRDSVRPAMAALAQRLRAELLPGARSDDRVGIRFVPGGDEGYAAAVARNTTTSLSPDEIHRIGLEVLEELAPRWSEIGRRALGETEFPAIAERLRSDPALRFRTSEEVVAVAEEALQRAQAAQDGWFPPRDLPPCVIEEINPVDARNATAMAYYRPPAVDGSRPGAHCLLATHPQERFRFEHEALAFHESVPGHHLQLATAQQLDLPRYRRHLDVEACSFNEGWGLYAEQLAEEMGLYSGDLALLGMLSFAALRACRLVIDTGVHHFGWSRERAVEFGWQHTATTREHLESEVDRYVCWPGQALAYQIGRREIVRLRERATAELGDRFDLSAFHGVVLGSGALPLPVLDENIARWTARVHGTAAGTSEEASAWT